MSELKPCPFCGDLPITKVRVTQMGGDTDIIDFSVACQSCGTDKTVRLRIFTTAKFDDVFRAISEATDAWNKRYKEDEQ